MVHSFSLKLDIDVFIWNAAAVQYEETFLLFSHSYPNETSHLNPISFLFISQHRALFFKSYRYYLKPPSRYIDAWEEVIIWVISTVWVRQLLQ